MPEFGVDLEQVNIKDLGYLEHTVVAQNMIDMVKKTTGKTISEHAYEALNGDILQQAYVPQKKTSAKVITP